MDVNFKSFILCKVWVENSREICVFDDVLFIDFYRFNFWLWTIIISVQSRYDWSWIQNELKALINECEEYHRARWRSRLQNNERIIQLIYLKCSHASLVIFEYYYRKKKVSWIDKIRFKSICCTSFIHFFNCFVCQFCK